MSNQKRRIAKPPKQTTPQTAADALPTEEAQRRRKHHIQPQVLELIRNNNGEPVTLKEVMAILDCPASSVQHSVLKLMRTVPQIQVVTRGQAWRWDAAASAAASEAEAEAEAEEYTTEQAEVWYLKVGTDASGRPLVREDGGTEVFKLISI